MFLVHKKIVKDKRKYYFPFIIYVFSIILLHVFMNTNLGDDVTSREITQGYTVIEWMVYRYFHWSARFVQEAIGFFMVWHPILWKFLDCIVLGAIPLLFAYLLDLQADEIIIAITGILLFPLIDMQSAGWICTTNTYLWPAFFGLIVFAYIKKYLKNQSLKTYELFLYYVFLVIASNHELSACFILAVFTYLFGYYICVQKKCKKLIGVSMVILVLDIIFVLVSPGNRLRGIAETKRWFPGYSYYNLIQKIWLGIIRVFKILVWNNSAVFIFFCIMLAVIGYLYLNNSFYRFFSFVPIVTITALKTTYTFFDIGDITDVGIRNISALFPVMCGSVLFVCIIFTLFQIYSRECFCRESGLVIVVFCAGVATLAVMGFSPTIYASAGRTATFMNFSIIYLSASLCKQFLNHLKGDDKKVILGVLCFLSVVLYIGNLWLVYLNN